MQNMEPRVAFQVRIPYDLYMYLCESADKNCRSRTSELEFILRQYFDAMQEDFG